MKTTPKKNGGFTLVELIVVIAILAILAAVAIPAYSGYIAKAEKANDLQLLGAVNQAFGAACVENNIFDMSTVEGTVISLDSNGYIVGMNVKENLSNAPAIDTTGNPMLASFVRYYGDNINTPFKYFHSKLVYGPDGFEGLEPGESASVFADIFNGIKGSVTNQIAALNASVFGTMGADVMMDKVDSVTGIAANLAGNSVAFKGMLNGNRKTLAEIMGYDWDDPASKAEFDAYYNSLVAQKAAEINPDDPTAAENAAKNEILANMAVLAAAKNTTESSDVLLGQLQEGISSVEIKNMLQGTNGSQDALSKSAMMYAMYTAYANGLPEGTDEEKAAKQTALNNANDVSTFMTAMDTDPGFANYLQNADGQAKKDLEGYLGALTIINTSAGTEDKSVITDLLMNGYGSDDLSEALNGLLGK